MSDGELKPIVIGKINFILRRETNNKTIMKEIAKNMKIWHTMIQNYWEDLGPTGPYTS